MQVMFAMTSKILENSVELVESYTVTTLTPIVGSGLRKFYCFQGLVWYYASSTYNQCLDFTFLFCETRAYFLLSGI